MKYNFFNPTHKGFFTPHNIAKFNAMLKNIAYELFMSKYKKVFNQCFPLSHQKCKTKNNQLWFDKDLYLLMVNKKFFLKSI